MERARRDQRVACSCGLPRRQQGRGAHRAQIRWCTVFASQEGMLSPVRRSLFSCLPSERRYPSVALGGSPFRQSTFFTSFGDVFLLCEGSAETTKVYKVLLEQTGSTRGWPPTWRAKRIPAIGADACAPGSRSLRLCRSLSPSESNTQASTHVFIFFFFFGTLKQSTHRRVPVQPQQPRFAGKKWFNAPRCPPRNAPHRRCSL